VALVVVADDAKQWQERLEAAGWSGETVPVDVADEIAELADVVIDVVRTLGEMPPEIAAVVGVGRGGRAAQLMALAGRTARLVLVDGLTHRFAGPDEVIADRMEWMRSRVAGEFPPIPRVESRSFAERAAAEVGVPTLVVETSASASAPEVVDAVATAFRQATVVRANDEAEAAAQVASWLIE
jgi:pimeloyl-ACP methyl ester carboxylesterase